MALFTSQAAASMVVKDGVAPAEVCHESEYFVIHFVPPLSSLRIAQICI